MVNRNHVEFRFRQTVISALINILRQSFRPKLFLKRIQKLTVVQIVPLSKVITCHMILNEVSWIIYVRFETHCMKAILVSGPDYFRKLLIRSEVKNVTHRRESWVYWP